MAECNSMQSLGYETDHIK